MNFDVHLQANFWDKSPSIAIKLDSKPIVTINDFVDKEKKTFSFTSDLNDGDHQLVIQRINKPVKDTIVKDSEIIKDSTVDIIDVVIDNISIDPLLDIANFFPQYPEPWFTQQKQAGKEPPLSYNYCRTLHHNGEWKLNFANPVHIWFFQNIDVQI